MACSARQQPGAACEECRRRKARCDRGRPQCGICAETGRACAYVSNKSQRGPKKGHLKDLRSRVGESGSSVHSRGVEDITQPSSASLTEARTMIIILTLSLQQCWRSGLSLKTRHSSQTSKMFRAWNPTRRRQSGKRWMNPGLQ